MSGYLGIADPNRHVRHEIWTADIIEALTEPRFRIDDIDPNSLPSPEIALISTPITREPGNAVRDTRPRR